MTFEEVQAQQRDAIKLKLLELSEQLKDAEKGCGDIICMHQRMIALIQSSNEENKKVLAPYAKSTAAEMQKKVNEQERYGLRYAASERVLDKLSKDADLINFVVDLLVFTGLETPLTKDIVEQVIAQAEKQAAQAEAPAEEKKDA